MNVNTFKNNNHLNDTQITYNLMKTKKKLIKILYFLSIIIISSCNKDDDNISITFSPEPTFTIFNNKETMPVWVNGNENSNYLILAIHGGPGSDVLDFRTYKGGQGFMTLENDFQIAYWQQRASGQSVGSNNTELFNIDTYVNDADAVVNELLNRYPNKEIILFGHSWGGMLSAAYLNDETRRAKVKAWINASGAHNGTILQQSTIDDINNEADARIQANENVNYWSTIKQQLIDNPDIYNAIAYSAVNEIPEVPIKVNFADFNLSERAFISSNSLFSEIVTSNFTSTLSNYNLPVLLLWGQYDFVVSKTLREEVLNNIGSENVTSITFQSSGHYIMFHQPELFAISIKNFIEGL
jgi:pimeloyl-ACP methyl ester carboxylesterase